MTSKKKPARHGFTLVEILIVVVILGILATIAIPQFSQSTDDARFSSALQSLQVLRQQIQLYRNQHPNVFPGSATDDTKFVDQMTEPTNAAGVVGAFGDTNFPFGPYLQENIPSNPFNGSRDVDSVTTLPKAAPGGTPGWIYEPLTGRIRINYDGTTPDGQTYWNL